MSLCCLSQMTNENINVPVISIQYAYGYPRSLFMIMCGRFFLDTSSYLKPSFVYCYDKDMLRLSFQISINFLEDFRYPQQPALGSIICSSGN